MLNLNNLSNTQSTHHFAGGTAVQHPSSQGTNLNWGGASNALQGTNSSNLLAIIMQMLQQLMGNSRGTAATGGNLLGGLLGGLGGTTTTTGGTASTTTGGTATTTGGGTATTTGRGTTTTTGGRVVPVNNGSQVWGDPHFKGAEGETYNIRGDDGKIYNLLSDKGIQLNSTFKTNLMQDYGLTIGNDKIAFDKTGKLMINGKEEKDGTYLNGAITKKGNSVKVKAGEYDLTFIAQKARGGYLDVKFASSNVAADGVMPHGLWGQTADGDGKKRTSSGLEGSGVLERLDGTLAKKGDKTYQLYEVTNIFDVNFANFNRFTGNNAGDVVRPTAARGEAE
ncbi:hypothetical protein [Thiofilum flexile]|uniref:hypothetical protein n=1 Tax=Thiofilum flexile TaxID=125627 RepID=UPI00037FF41A|nr:hypothetical protein [Thiofilum flexile]